MSHPNTSTSKIKLAYSSIEQLLPYQTGKPIDALARELGIDNQDDIIKLASNENPLGCSPQVKEAILATLDNASTLARYPDGSGYHLKHAISSLTGCPISCITLGNGSNDLLELVARTFVSAKDEVIFSQYAFAIYRLVTLAIGAVPVMTPAIDYAHNLATMLASITDNTRLVFIANPNNPTGTMLSQQAIRRFLEACPSHVLVVLDEAYIEYCPETNNIDLLTQFDNLVLTRTFSKAYGLASLRVGYMLASSTITDYVNRLRQPFNVNHLAQVAAVAAIDDQEFMAQSRQANQIQMRWLEQQLDSLGLGFIPSYGNFICVQVGDGERVYQQLLQQGIIVRPLVGYAMPQWIRITIGQAEENARLIDTLKQILA